MYNYKDDYLLNISAYASFDTLILPIQEKNSNTVKQVKLIEIKRVQSREIFFFLRTKVQLFKER